MVQYIVECIAFQLVFLIIYDFFLKKETFFQWNRGYLLSTYALSMLLPWVKIEALKTKAPKVFQEYPEFMWHVNDTVFTVTNSTETSAGISWEYLVLFGGMFVATVLLGYKLYQLYRLKQQGEIHYFKNFTRVVIKNSAMAFSFFKSIFLGDKIFEKEHQNIVAHELVHINEKHSYDLFFFELMRIVAWFNPLVYVYQNRISELHEFIADAKVAKESKKEQYEFLLSQVFQTQNISFINQFFKSSLIKKRIVMLQKSKSKQIFKLKYLLLIPLILGILFYTSCQKGVNESETISVGDIANLTNNEESQVFNKLTELSKTSKEWKLFVQDDNSSIKFINSDNESYISGPNGEKIYAKLAIDSKLEKKELDLFTAFLKKNNDSKYNQLVEERQRLLRSTNEKNPVIVNIDAQIEALKKSIFNDQEIIPFAVVDEVPVFPGCEDETNKRACFNKMMQKHISKYFNYPKKAQELGIQGRVSVMFTINETGDIVGLRMRGPDPILEKEVERIINRLPKMKPGKHNGKTVSVPFSIPVSFRLASSSNKTFDNEENSNKTLEEISPLIIIDGKESSKIEFEKLQSTGLNTIEEINVIKDKAALKKYGQKGKNGVIEIVTKKN